MAWKARPGGYPSATAVGNLALGKALAFADIEWVVWDAVVHRSESSRCTFEFPHWTTGLIPAIVELTSGHTAKNTTLLPRRRMLFPLAQRRTSSAEIRVPSIMEPERSAGHGLAVHLRKSAMTPGPHNDQHRRTLECDRHRLTDAGPRPFLIGSR